MKILTGEQIRQADQATLEREPVESIDLMERASEVMAQWFCNNIPQETPLCFMVGKGNNGGDGLAVARMLHNVGYVCVAYLLFDRKEMSPECAFNLKRLPKEIHCRLWQPDEARLDPDVVVVDALLGSGVRGALNEGMEQAIGWINAQRCRVISIDLPSGMLTEYGNRNRWMVQATNTLTLEFPKLALLLPEGGEAAGEIVILPIDLDPDFIEDAPTQYCYVTEEMIESMRLSRAKFAHKGSGGHALLVCGSEGMAGAAALAAGGALRSGCGWVTVHLPREERMVIHLSNTSAMVSCDPNPAFSQLPAQMERYSVVGVGCGLGMADDTVAALRELLQTGKPMVIDADALNILAQHTELQTLVPKGSIVTPHPGELRRLVGEWNDDRERNEKVIEWAARLSIYVVVKGAHTMICTPDGRLLFNSTGNPGMAKAGSGDVLTGLITGLWARGYDPENAAILGVYLHGEAGDKAAEYFGQEGMNGSDIIDFINAPS